MHELSIVKEVIDMVCVEAERNNINVVKKIVLVIGSLMYIDEDCLSLAFELLGKGTVCEECKVEIKEKQGFQVILQTVEGEAWEE